MSKAVSKIYKKNLHSLDKIQHPVPAIREVQPVAIKDENNSNVIAVYKDLNQPLKDFVALEQKHLFIGFMVFIILGLGIMAGQHFSKSRGVASTDMAKLIPAGAETTAAEHYHYDKSCYTGANGEQVCMTRTSQKR